MMNVRYSFQSFQFEASCMLSSAFLFCLFVFCFVSLCVFCMLFSSFVLNAKALSNHCAGEILMFLIFCLFCILETVSQETLC